MLKTKHISVYSRGYRITKYNIAIDSNNFMQEHVIGHNLLLLWLENNMHVLCIQVSVCICKI